MEHNAGMATGFGSKGRSAIGKDWPQLRPASHQRYNDVLWDYLFVDEHLLKRRTTSVRYSTGGIDFGCRPCMLSYGFKSNENANTGKLLNVR